MSSARSGGCTSDEIANSLGLSAVSIASTAAISVASMVLSEWPMATAAEPNELIWWSTISALPSYVVPATSKNCFHVVTPPGTRPSR